MDSIERAARLTNGGKNEIQRNALDLANDGSTTPPA
jgi:hypothetical protein